MKFLWRDENHFSFFIVKLEFVVGHPGLDIRNAELSGVDDSGQRRNFTRLVKLIVVRVAVMRQRVVRYNFRDRLGVEEKENRAEDRTLRNIIQHNITYNTNTASLALTLSLPGWP